MPEKKTRLSQMIINAQKSRGITDRVAAEELGAIQQTFSSWKRGSIPRETVHPALAAFLNISADMLAELVEEAAVSTGSTKLPAMHTARVYGRMADRKDGKIKFDPVNAGRKRIPEGRYAIIVDTKVMEPVFHVGVKAWIEPNRWPQRGDDVVVHSGGYGWIGTFEGMADNKVTLSRYAGDSLVVEDVEAVHVIVLSERVAG